MRLEMLFLLQPEIRLRNLPIDINNLKQIITATVEKLKAMGAKEYEPITKREEGFITASVVGPFGNILGVMYNTHYLEILASTKNA